MYVKKSLVFHKKGNVLLAGSRDGSLALWNCHNGKLMNTFLGHRDAVTKTAFTPDGLLIREVYSKCIR